MPASVADHRRICEGMGGVRETPVTAGTGRGGKMDPQATNSPKLYTKNPKAQLKASIDAANNKTRGREARSRRGKVKPVYLWTTDDVTKWVRKYCGQLHSLYSDLFRQHEVTGRTLTGMTDNKLQMMGVTNAQHREELMRQIVRLKLKTDTQDLKEMDQKDLIEKK